MFAGAFMPPIFSVRPDIALVDQAVDTTARAGSYTFYLATAWRNAKASAMSLAERRTEALAKQIEALSFKTLRYDTAPMRRALENQLSAVSA
ncbi:hypothetical protein [Aminobacter aminovorans]|uniref:Uncharacterized protein n=1 Tax=Aminobacter aminovorans TaxID=83263 RepID=A0AAC9AQI8_AMIAI|nr:hypothetical protein [Aminobacter aminovorans]AMS40501.1 hypothetical protein AA2016_1569 [Aminobacter aminovorans]MBB3706567.1 hypothetical protein [Aminobacter aminovorans]